MSGNNKIPFGVRLFGVLLVVFLFGQHFFPSQAMARRFSPTKMDEAVRSMNMVLGPMLQDRIFWPHTVLTNNARSGIRDLEKLRSALLELIFFSYGLQGSARSNALNEQTIEFFDKKANDTVDPIRRSFSSFCDRAFPLRPQQNSQNNEQVDLRRINAQYGRQIDMTVEILRDVDSIMEDDFIGDLKNSVRRREPLIEYENHIGGLLNQLHALDRSVMQLIQILKQN